MADASNNIFDPSCNPSADYDYPTAIVNHDYPNVVYVAMQQPAYNEEGTVEFYDISNINLIGNSYNTQFNYDQTNISSTKVSYEEGKLRIEFPVDLSGNDLSLNYTNIDDGIRDQNGGILQSFTELDICSNVLWRDVSGDEGSDGDVNGDGAYFETGYPAIFTGTSTTQVYCRWNPNFTDFENTGGEDTFVLMNSNGDKIKYETQESEQRVEEGNVVENILKIKFGQNLMSSSLSSYRTLLYKKPVGKAGIRLGQNSRFWLRDFSNNVFVSGSTVP